MGVGSIKNSGDDSVNSISIQKVLHILGVIRSLPSGALIHQQIEQILLEYDNQQIRVEQVYVKLLQSLLDIFQSRIPEESPLIIRLKLLQARLQPPLLLNDVGELESEYKKCLTEMVQVLGNPENSSDDVAYAEAQEGEQGSEPIETLPGIFLGNDETATPSGYEVKGKGVQEISEIRDTLSHKLREAVQQKSGFLCHAGFDDE